MLKQLHQYTLFPHNLVGLMLIYLRRERVFSKTITIVVNYFYWYNCKIFFAVLESTLAIDLLCELTIDLILVMQLLLTFKLF